MVETDSGTTFYFFSDSDAVESTVGPLHPYYTYTCTVSAVTVGEGPPSELITVRTAEDGTSKVMIIDQYTLSFKG